MIDTAGRGVSTRHRHFRGGIASAGAAVSTTFIRPLSTTRRHFARPPLRSSSHCDYVYTALTYLPLLIPRASTFMPSGCLSSMLVDAGDADMTVNIAIQATWRRPQTNHSGGAFSVRRPYRLDVTKTGRFGLQPHAARILRCRCDRQVGSRSGGHPPHTPSHRHPTPPHAHAPPHHPHPTRAHPTYTHILPPHHARQALRHDMPRDIRALYNTLRCLP